MNKMFDEIMNKIFGSTKDESCLSQTCNLVCLLIILLVGFVSIGTLFYCFILIYRMFY